MSPKAHKGLFSLPSEIIERILCSLDLRTLLKCKEVCKKLKGNVDSTKAIQYLMELEVAGYERNPNNTWLSAECLECLQKYQSVWERLEWSKEQTLPMLGGGLWELYAGILVRTDEDGTFHFTKLPSVTRRIEEETWKVTPDIDDIRDFGIDPSQDLLVWITAPKSASPFVSLHLRTLRTAKNHPLARKPVLQHDHRMRPGRWHFAIKIMGDYIGLQASRRAGEDGIGNELSEFFIWNWKEDKLEVALQTNYLQSFAFLSDRHIVLANLYISDDLESDTTEGYLTLLDFKAEDPTRKQLDDACYSLKLCYPNLSEDAVITEFELTSEPSPSWTPGRNDKSPFFVAKENRIFTVSMRIRPNARAEFTFDHFIPLSAFRKCLDILNESPGQRLCWSDWAAKDTRLLRASLPASNVWVCFAYGSRCMKRELNRKVGSALSLVTFDFNQLALRRDEARGKQNVPGSYTRDMSCKGALGSNLIWTESTETSLPYIRYTNVLPIVVGDFWPSVMCTADNLILVDMRTQGYKIYTF